MDHQHTVEGTITAELCMAIDISQNGIRFWSIGSIIRATISEDDVRRAIQKDEKIFINGRTIITPAARDMGEPAEVFAKV